MEVDGQQLSLRKRRKKKRHENFIPSYLERAGKGIKFNFKIFQTALSNGPIKTALPLSLAMCFSLIAGFKQHYSEHAAQASVHRTPCTCRGQTKSQANTHIKSNQRGVNKTFFEAASDKTKSEQITLFVLHQMPMPFSVAQVSIERCA